MTERPIMLRDNQVVGIATGRRTHLCMPAVYTGRPTMAPARAALGDRGMPIPTPWAALESGSVLWVQEAGVVVWDENHPLNQRHHYAADLRGGKAPMPRNTGRERWIQRRVDPKQMTRDQSRFVLVIAAARAFNAQEITWEEIDAESGMRFPTDSKPQWWLRNYGVFSPWENNPAMIGLSFKAEYRNVDGVPLGPRKGATADV